MIVRIAAEQRDELEQEIVGLKVEADRVAAEARELGVRGKLERILKTKDPSQSGMAATCVM